jgi:hypothetical protein
LIGLALASGTPGPNVNITPNNQPLTSHYSGNPNRWPSNDLKKATGLNAYRKSNHKTVDFQNKKVVFLSFLLQWQGPI